MILVILRDIYRNQSIYLRRSLDCRESSCDTRLKFSTSNLQSPQSLDTFDRQRSIAQLKRIYHRATIAIGSSIKFSLGETR